MPARHSVCPLDCPDRCSLEVQVEEGRVTAITGSRVQPLTGGYICAKVREFTHRVYGPDRLLRPLRRSGPRGSGQFEPLSWDEALDIIARQLAGARERHGGESILPFFYGGSNGLLTQGTTDERLFRSLGASRLARTVCAAPTTAVAQAQYGGMASVDFPDVALAKYVIIWGANPKHSNLHLMPYLKAARAAGARVALVDPRRTLTDSYIDRHLPIFPGTDAAVALAMIGHLERSGGIDTGFLRAHARGWEKLLERARAFTLERAASLARVEPAAIARIAEEYAAAEPALVRCGWGLERNRNGEASVAAVLALPAVAGKFGRPGGGYALAASAAYRIDEERAIGVKEASTRVINMNRLGRALLEERQPPIKVLFVYNANPVVTIPDQNRVVQGLRREDLFTVVFDQVLTDTALYADIVLPATTFLEHRELSTSYGTYTVMLAEPVIPPRGESRPNEEVFAQILDRLGIDDRGARGEPLLREILGAIEGPIAAGPAGGGADGAARLERLRREPALAFDFPGARPVQFGSVFPGTPDRRIDLWPAALGSDPYLILDDPAGARHPLALISPATDRTISSTLGEFNHDDVRLEMHPDDARPRSLRDGQLVRVHNELGEVVVGVRINADVRPGVVVLPKGIWNRHTKNGRVGTALVPDTISAISGAACFNDARVDVAPA